MSIPTIAYSAPASAYAAACVWALLTVSVTALVSFVIHGLQQRVRAAMQLGQCVLESKLGEGGLGVVYRARHAMLPRYISMTRQEASSWARP